MGVLEWFALLNGFQFYITDGWYRAPMVVQTQFYSPLLLPNAGGISEVMHSLEVRNLFIVPSQKKCTNHTVQSLLA